MKKLLPISTLLFLSIICFQCQDVSSTTLQQGVFPRDGQILSLENSKNLTLSWLPMKLNTEGETKYRISIFKVNQDSTANKSIRYNFEQILQKTVETSHFNFPTKSFDFEPNRMYAWEVDGIDSQRRTSIIKPLTSFYFHTNKISFRGVPSNLPVALDDFCLACWFDENCHRQCDPFAYCRPAIHRSTGLFSLLPPEGNEDARKSATVGLESENERCGDLDSSGRLGISSLLTVRVPIEFIDIIDKDSIVVKVFRNRVLIPDNEVQILSFQSLHNGTPDSLVASRNDYKKVCKDPVSEEFLYEAIFNIRFKFRIALRGSRNFQFPQRHEIFLDLIPTGVHQNNDITHEHADIPFSSPCENVIPDTYEYYDCLYNNANDVDPSLHRGFHIVPFTIDPYDICGPWNRLSPVVLSPEFYNYNYNYGH